MVKYLGQDHFLQKEGSKVCVIPLKAKDCIKGMKDYKIILCYNTT